MERDIFKTENFIIKNIERDISLEQLREIAKDVDENMLEALKTSRKCACMRCEHKTGVWSVEYPIYCQMFFIIGAFKEDDATDMKTLDNMLGVFMEDTTFIGDEQYYKDMVQAKRRLAERHKQ